jgi:LmbE family N-acetylglucosaminyl deacetylase
MTSDLKVLALFAHPDDAEFLAAGTLAQLAELGAQVTISTMTAGDCGSTVLPAQKITRIRRREAANSARLIGAEYICLDEKDLEVFYDRRTLRKVMEVVRRVDPSLVFTHSPEDYMLDHEMTSRLAQTACFGAMAPNYPSGARRKTANLRAIPHLYYSQPFGGRNILGQPVRARVYINIAATLDLKAQMLACHESQRAFLQAQQDIPDLLSMMRQMARQAGHESGFEHAEGFRQHLGQGFPQSDALGECLRDRVRWVER